MTSALRSVTKPAAGVMATSPATTPEHRPSSEARLRASHSAAIHDSAPAAAAMWVTASASPARPSAASAEPALKPNQPTQSRPVPAMVRPRLKGMKASRP
ncbi:hypothetical protein FQZ97_970140 [compost metagenome]